MKNGLPYFVPSERAEARKALTPRRLAPLVLAVALLGVSGGAALSFVRSSLSFLPATLTQIIVVAAVFYALTSLRARPIVTWAGRRIIGSIRQLIPTITRALPLLLVFVTFLFVNAEVWQLSANLDGGALWLVVLLFAVVGVAFFLTSIPAEIDRVDHTYESEAVARACVGTPMEEQARRLEAQGVDLGSVTSLRQYERLNLMLVLLLTQFVQVLLVAAGIFAFLFLFGLIAMNDVVATTWTSEESLTAWGGLPNLSIELLQVCVFLSSFSGLYFTVYAVTDDTFRAEFFGTVVDELDRATAVRAAYLELREEQGLPDISVDEPDDQPDDQPDERDPDQGVAEDEITGRAP
ncbi:hypothetical protein KLP28_00860 [Nocardioidaceae bacterium]|nr:hypothetical protein KLP28_00860 [Nocardioidaceae bacterium]